MYFIHTKEELKSLYSITEEHYQEEFNYLNQYIPLLKEAYDNKIKSFKIDW